MRAPGSAKARTADPASGAEHAAPGTGSGGRSEAAAVQSEPVLLPRSARAPYRQEPPPPRLRIASRTYRKNVTAPVEAAPPPCWMRAGRRPAGPGRSRTEAPRALPPSPPAPRPWARPGPAARPAPHGGPILAASLARPLGLARARPKPLCYPRPRHGPAWTPAALSGAAGIYACR